MTVRLKDNVINEIIRIEGGYVNNPDDSGGETKYGITEAVARAYGYHGKMIDLPREIAYTIYQKKYWDAVQGDELARMSEPVAREIVDTSVNMHPRRAAKFLQRALNVLNKKQKLYNDIKVDGQIGPATLSALTSYLQIREESVLTKMLNSLQGAFYVTLAERREKDETFIYGWFKNRVVL